MTFATIRQPFLNYYDALPQNIGSTIVKSAGLTFAVTIIFSQYQNNTLNLVIPILKAGVAALACTIHALMTPLFNQIFQTKKLKFFDEFFKSAITGTLASTAVAFMATSNINVTAIKLFYLISANSFTALFSSQDSELFIKENSIYMCI